MQTKYIIASVAILFFMLLGIGAVLSERCVNIDGCRSCWSTTPVVVQSELCTNGTCLAQPADQQNNAIVDAVLCACNKAKSASYTDADLNKNIENVIAEFTLYNVSAGEVCEQPGFLLVRRSYD